MPPERSRLAWAVLALLLAALLAGAATFDPRRWPGVVGDEASYLLQAQSLAWDGDLRYSRADFDRFVTLRGARPEGVILQSSDGGRTLLYGKPALYAAWLTPFVRLMPARGPAVANALLLAVAAIAAARALSRRLGPAAPLWVAAWVFASVVFAYVFWVHSDLFLMCLVALALSLAWGGTGADARPEAPRRRFLLRWAGAGVLLALVVMSRPPYAALLLPLALAVPRERRRQGLAALLGGLAAAVLLITLADVAVRGTWSSYTGERQAFYSFTGFPGVDLPPGGWAARTRRVSGSWVERQTLGNGFQARQTAWNALYFLLGRHVGVAVYFLPLLLGVAAFRPGEGRGALLAAAALAAAVFLLIRPFNFWGGGGSIANRYFLPLYPALWFLAARPPRGPRSSAAWLAPVAAAALAAPFLWPLWTEPRAFPLAADGSYRWVSATARRLLPYETTQSHLKPSGRDDFLHNRLWVKPLTPAVAAEMDGRVMRLAPGQEAEVLFGYERPLAAVRLRFPPPGPRRVTLDGETRATSPRPAGGAVVRLALPRPRAHHRMWWNDDFYLYELKLALPPGEPPPPGGLRFQIVPEIVPEPRPAGERQEAR
jgi:hypothetical protein